MNEEDVVEPQTPKKSDLILGRKIQKARKVKNLSQVDLSDKLNLHVTTVEFLEAEQFDELPAPAFVRGYIRAIGIELSLDVDEMLNIYAAHNQPDPNLSSTSAAEKQKKSSDPSMVWGTFALLIVVIVLLVVWVVNSLGQQSVEPTAERSEAAAPVLPEIQLSLAPINENAEFNAAPISAQGASALPLAPETLTAPSEVTPASITPAAPQGSDSLTITAKGPSWADIRDASGFQLIYGLLDKNDKQQRVTGKAPFSVFLGDAKQIDLEFQGKAFDFSRHVRANNVAKFSVK